MNSRGSFFFFFFFLLLLVDSGMSGTVVVAKHKILLIPESFHKIPCLLNFTHPCKEISHKMKGFVKKQLSSLKKSFKFD